MGDRSRCFLAGLASGALLTAAAVLAWLNEAVVVRDSGVTRMGGGGR